MATIAEIRQQYPQYEDMSDEALADALYRKFYSDMPREEFNAKVGVQPAYDGGSFRAATEGSHAGLMLGYDDEITAGMLAPVDAAIDWAKGEGFDMGRAYTRKQQALDAQKAARREQHPVASIAGEIAGGLAVGGNAAAKGSTLIGRSIPILSKAAPRTASLLAAAGEGAAYGGLYGSGEAKPGERLSGAGTGAVIGGLTGGVLQGVGNAIASRAARRAAAKAAPAVDDLSAQSNALYKLSEQKGVMFRPQAVGRLRQNIRLAAGQPNEKLRPLTAGTVDDANRMLNGQMTLKQMDEFRQGIGLDLKTAKGQDRMFLTRIKEQVDNFIDNIQPGDFTGDHAGIPILREAQKLWGRSRKTEIIEKIMDSADVRTGQYTQSGLANTIRSEMRTLYKQIQKGKTQGFTKEEIALIRQIAKGGSSSTIVNLFAKFAPRGVVSIASGQLVGSMVPGVGNVLMPMAGHIAGEAADRGAAQAVQSLRNAVASGAPIATPQIARRTAPFIGGGAAGSTEVPRLLEASRRR